MTLVRRTAQKRVRPRHRGDEQLADALRGAVDAGRVNGRVAGEEDDLLRLHRLRRLEDVERAEDVGLERLVRVLLHHRHVLVGGEMEDDLRPRRLEDVLEACCRSVMLQSQGLTGRRSAAPSGSSSSRSS